MFVILKGKTRAPIGKFKAVHTQQKRIKIFVRTALPVSKPFDFIQHFGIIFFIYGKARIGEFFPFPRYDKRIVFTNRFSVFVQEIAVPIARFVMAVFKPSVIHCFPPNRREKHNKKLLSMQCMHLRQCTKPADRTVNPTYRILGHLEKLRK